MTNYKAIELRNRIIELRAKHKAEALDEFKRGVSLIKHNACPVLALTIDAAGKAICDRISKFCK